MGCTNIMSSIILRIETSEKAKGKTEDSCQLNAGFYFKEMRGKLLGTILKVWQENKKE